MRKRLLLLVIFILGICTTTIFFLTLFYVDPLADTFLALGLIIFSFYFSIASFTTLILYFIKKVYFRGDVYIFHVLTSFRQWTILALFLIGIVGFYAFSVLSGWAILALAMFFSTLELFIQNITHKNS